MFKVACIQICSDKDLKKNLQISKKLILKAINKKSDLIITPENSSLFGLNKKQLMKHRYHNAKRFLFDGD